MRIVADEHIPYVREAFSSIGKVDTCDACELTQDRISGADVLVVRSVTAVDANLLAGTGIRCVATATSGLDHLDVESLEAAAVGVVNAQGANAWSVAEYVLAALVELVSRSEKPLADHSCGIVGFGHVGSAVYKLLSGLGLRCCVYDPWLAGSDTSIPFCDWDTIAKQDIVTLHTPLVQGGRYPTFHMIDESFLGRMVEDSILINASRGGVVDGAALLHAKQRGTGLRTALDVWEGEPDISVELLGCTDLATPHIAGYSWEAKVEATRRVYRGVCEHFGLTASWEGPLEIPTARVDPVTLEGLSSSALTDHVWQGYPIALDDATLRQGLSLTDGTMGEHFSILRNGYKPRREYLIRS